MSVKKSVENLTIRPGKKYAGLRAVLQEAADKADFSLNKYILKHLSKTHGYTPPTNQTRRK